MSITFPMADADVCGKVSQPEPNWLYPVLDAFQRLGQLEVNWDSYHGRRISAAAVVSALQFLHELFPQDGPLPAVVPTSAGGVQLEWRGTDFDLEAEFGPTGGFCGELEISSTALPWEFDQLTPEVISRLQAVLPL